MRDRIALAVIVLFTAMLCLSMVWGLYKAVTAIGLMLATTADEPAPEVVAEPVVDEPEVMEAGEPVFAGLLAQLEAADETEPRPYVARRGQSDRHTDGERGWAEPPSDFTCLDSLPVYLVSEARWACIDDERQAPTPGESYCHGHGCGRFPSSTDENFDPMYPPGMGWSGLPSTRWEPFY